MIRGVMCERMKRISINTDKIVDWDSFHDVFAEALGFPCFYGRNMNAWIDCMTCLDCPEDGMTSIHVDPGQVLILELSDATSFASRCPEIYDAVIECSAFVNYRRLEQDDPAVLALSYNKDNT